MKTLILTAAIMALGTTAFAGQSDRLKDLRLSTSISTIDYTNPTVSTASSRKTTGANVTFSFRNAGKSGNDTPYPYTNRFGVGPYNDSR